MPLTKRLKHSGLNELEEERFVKLVDEHAYVYAAIVSDTYMSKLDLSWAFIGRGVVSIEHSNGIFCLKCYDLHTRKVLWIQEMFREQATKTGLDDTNILLIEGDDDCKMLNVPHEIDYRDFIEVFVGISNYLNLFYTIGAERSTTLMSYIMKYTILNDNRKPLESKRSHLRSHSRATRGMDKRLSLDTDDGLLDSSGSSHCSPEMHEKAVRKSKFDWVKRIFTKPPKRKETHQSSYRGTSVSSIDVLLGNFPNSMPQINMPKTAERKAPLKPQRGVSQIDLRSLGLPTKKNSPPLPFLDHRKGISTLEKPKLVRRATLNERAIRQLRRPSAVPNALETNKAIVQEKASGAPPPLPPKSANLINKLQNSATSRTFKEAPMYSGRQSAPPLAPTPPSVSGQKPPVMERLRNDTSVVQVETGSKVPRDGQKPTESQAEANHADSHKVDLLSEIRGGGWKLRKTNISHGDGQNTTKNQTENPLGAALRKHRMFQNDSEEESEPEGTGNTNWLN